MRSLLRRLAFEDDGQDLVEYMLLGGSIALASALTLDTFGDVINDVYASWNAGTQAIWEPQDPM